MICTLKEIPVTCITTVSNIHRTMGLATGQGTHHIYLHSHVTIFILHSYKIYSVWRSLFAVSTHIRWVTHVKQVDWHWRWRDHYPCTTLSCWSTRTWVKSSEVAGMGLEIANLAASVTSAFAFFLMTWRKMGRGERREERTRMKRREGGEMWGW